VQMYTISAHQNSKGQYWWLANISEPNVSNLGTWTFVIFLPFRVPWKSSQRCRFTPFPSETSIFHIFQFSFGIFYSPTSPMDLFSLINLLMLLLSRKDFKTQFLFSPAKLKKKIIKPHKVYFQTKTPFNHLKL
jgi:hypothetical protein